MNQQFKNRNPGIIGEGQFQHFGILVSLVKEKNHWHFLFEKRASHLDTQPGEVCFPGGRVEKGETPEDASIRETCEELLLMPNQITLLGPSDRFVSPFNLILHPFIAKINHYDGSYNTDEVAKTFTVPLDYFRKNRPQNFNITLKHVIDDNFPVQWVPRGKDYPWRNGRYKVGFYPHQEEIIWGLTARIVQNAIKLIDDFKLLI